MRNTRICKDGPVFLADDVERLSVDEQRERIAGGCMCGTVKVLDTAKDTADKGKED